MHYDILLKKCLHFRAGSSLQEVREREEYKRDCHALYSLLRNTEQHMLDRLVNNSSSIRQVIPGLYTLVSLYIYVHICAQMIQNWNTEGYIL